MNQIPDDIQIILPVYNEKESIEQVIKEWCAVLNTMKLRYNLIICEDGSTDGTSDLLKQLKKQYPLRLNQKQYRRGYAGAVVSGITSANARYVLCADSDGQCDPEDFPAFWRRRRNGVLIGWRKNRNDRWSRKLFSKMFGTVYRLFFPTQLHDPSAPFVLFRPEIIKPYANYLLRMREGFWWGFVAICRKKHIQVKEIPIHHRKRTFGTTNVFHISKIPQIVLRNLRGLISLRVSRF